MIADEIRCLKNVGLIQLNNATSYCQSLNADQTLPSTKKESDDLVSALLSLDLSSENDKTLVSNWLLNELESAHRNYTGYETETVKGNYAGFRIDTVNRNAEWADYSGSDELSIVCTKRVGHGKNY